jgi:hypothetical protein
MGVLGWTSEQTLETLLVEIEMALNSRYRFAKTILEAVFGSEPTSKAPLTPELFRSWFSS